MRRTQSGDTRSVPRRWPVALVAAIALGAMCAAPAAANAASQSTSASAAELVVYVSPDGDDASDGTIDSPLRTITAARDALAGRTSADAPGTVWIRGGEYVLDDAITLAGDEHSWVTYAAYRGEDVQITGAHQLSADGWQKLSEMSDDALAEPQFSSQSRLHDESARAGAWVYDLGAAGVEPGTLYKNGFNWLQQPFAPELAVDGTLQTLAEYPNDDSCTTSQTDCHLWGTGSKWGATAPRDLMHVDLEGRFGVEDDWQASGTSPRAQFEDKKQQLPDGVSRDTWSQDELRKMTPAIFEVGGRALEGDRYQGWAPEAVPTVHDWGTRGFGEYADIPVQADPEWIEDIDNSRYETEGWLAGYLGNNYANEMVRMLSWSGTTLYTKYPSMYIPVDGYTKVKATNVLAELDAPGEYYIDRFEGNDVLYFMPEGGTIDGKQITLSAFDENFFTLEGTTGVVLRDLAMSNSLVSGVQLLDAEDTLIDGVEISNVSMDAIRIGETTETITALPDYETVRGGHGNVVRNSFLHDLGGGGVLLGGGDRDTLERGDNVAHHNEITRFSKLATYTPAGYLYGVGNSFEYNYVHDAPHMAVQIMGNDMKVNHNHFFDVLQNAGDQGVVYTGRDYTYLGNEVAYNLFEKVGGKNDAFYMDDGVSGMRFHHNVVKDSHSGVFFQSGHSNTANDNVFIDVARTGHDQLYHRKGEKGLPVSNAWVVQSRFNAYLDVREGEKYSSTPEIIEAWVEHYTNGAAEYSDGTPIAFPEIDDWYVPRVTETGEPCTVADYAVDATNGCSRSDIWENEDSLYVQARNELDHSVIIGGGEYQGSTNTFANPASSYSLSRWSDKINTNLVKPDSVEAAGLDLETLQFSSSGAVAESFGAEWVERWNGLVSRDGMGRPDRGDAAALWTEVDRAERFLATDPVGDTAGLEDALGAAVAVGDATDASQAHIDEALAALTTSIEALLPPVPGRVVLSDDNSHDGIRGSSFTVTANMWWGENGTSFRLFEDGVVVAEVALDADTPSAQKVTVPISGKPNGEYTYTCELVNFTGATPCAAHVVKVDAAAPAKPVLSHDNRDRNGDYTVTADLRWGTNATSWSLSEDGVEIATGELADATPQAQRVSVALEGRGSGAHSYVMKFMNALGQSESKAMVVDVR
ncbi:right-handed parallel beta-helix repeat-containing protein [Agromyces sp. SYSU K20354]|uniref:right-handed parallel beta-helix repeat-containing protein n=1 Tax=Agromyces cavernae TaxID=2898659 RepID=UPI001E357FFB|nr:right-handed parallel beta-helix repeat-containing protein [Agromyces cavernae]MCD2443433.1 right-handed parallel beta-helix repeat-containing protein [Agromyces cavernae]